MKRYLKYVLGVLGFVVLTGMGPIPEPIRNCAGQLVNRLGQVVSPIHGVGLDSHGRRRACTIWVEAPRVDPNNRFRIISRYQLMDPQWDDWSWYNNCAVAARKVGQSLPIVKATGDGNELGRTPIIYGIITRPPLIHIGEIEWYSMTTADVAVWRRAHLAVAAAR